MQVRAATPRERLAALTPDAREIIVGMADIRKAVAHTEAMLLAVCQRFGVSRDEVEAHAARIIAAYVVDEQGKEGS